MTKQTFQPGNQVRVSDRKDATIFEFVRALPNCLCEIREEGIAPNGKPYAVQVIDQSLLKHAVTDEMLKAFSPLPAGRKTELSAPRSDTVEIEGYVINRLTGEVWVKKSRPHDRQGRTYLSRITSARKIKRLLKLANA